MKFCLAIISAFAAWIICAPILAEVLIVTKEIKKPDAIVVLAGSAVYKERNSHAAELFREGAAPMVVLTDDGRDAGWSDRDKRNLKYVELAKRVLISVGVPEEKIVVLDAPVEGTIDEAKLIVARADGLGLKRILLVTSSYHSSRTLRTFEDVAAREGKQVEFGIDPVRPGLETPKPLTWWLSVRGWRFVAGEWVKSIYYKAIV